MPSGGHNRKSSINRQSSRSYTTPAPADKPAPPDGMTAAGLAMFAELLAAIPAGAAGKSDSLALSLAAELLAQFRQAPDEFPAGKLATLRGLLTDFALTPSARQRMDVVQAPAVNPFAQFDRACNRQPLAVVD